MVIDSQSQINDSEASLVILTK